ncbi:NADH-quinone oxidoreductase subunit L [Salirhabdus salicampi]|uniref:NADH-quinone oxidoreductase subunit L n=1 Tax=Salirhabdus salicampi TaxID=476102 RepID=UPI0020C579CC|nr:NADH-quinone oxidoreductase subunit L [Salirhabdus salicampi]MCP8617456.1 NADH-quinone oxidoreductase subunit L [Salirhabdus salicampi]
MFEMAWLIPLLPFVSFIILISFRSYVKDWSGYIASFFVGVSLLLALFVGKELLVTPLYEIERAWLTIGSLELTVGILLNPLNGLMIVLVAFISFLIHLYSIGYMKGDDRYSVFFAYLSLFSAAMLGLVMSPNLLQFYMFWELVGLGSFLLIGFYFYKESAKQAAKKAFIITRIGDIGLLIGIILLFWQTGSLHLSTIFSAITNGEVNEGMITFIAILFFVGAIGKSGQFPLHTWLPDAMEGPTPVSALIHAATMVAAGVYLVAVMYPLFALSEVAMLTVAIVGAFTAIFAATIGLVQNDVKRVLAYSTVSQLGYMMLALGMAGYVAGIFHLFTHAFFKALLFVAAGAIIHQVHTQNIKQMGGLRHELKFTNIIFLIGTLAISGFPFLSGFFSKEAIFVAIWERGNYGLFVVALVTAFLTSLYMFRLYFLMFYGRNKGKEVERTPLSIAMKIPMGLLALLAILAGYSNSEWFGSFLAHWLYETNAFIPKEHHGGIWLIFITTIVSLSGIYLAYLIYVKKSVDHEEWKDLFSSTYRMFYNKYYLDEWYQYTFVNGARAIGIAFRSIEKYVIQLTIEVIRGAVTSLSRLTSKLQTGQPQLYGTVAFVGFVVILFVFIVKGGHL